MVLGGFPAFGLQAAGVDRQAASASLASANRSLGDYQSAERVLRGGLEDPSGSVAGRVTLMVNLADLLREEARWSEADQILNTAAALQDLPRQAHISILLERAELRREMHQWVESIEDWNEIGRIAEKENSKSLEEVYTGGLGETWLASGETARAEPLLRRSLALLRKDPAASPSQIATALALMAQLYAAEDKLALAREALEEAIARDEVCLGQEHPQVAVMLELHATILSRRGETDAARADLDRARSIMTTHFGEESTAVAGVDATLGYLEESARQPELAAAAYGRALTLLHKTGADGLKFSEQLAKRYAATIKSLK
jgi:tetratricopeptide (TPR) repeat protein